MSTDTLKKNHYWNIYLVVFILLSTMAVLRYQSIHSGVYDMGLYINNLYMISEGYWERLFLSHIQPLNFFWSLLYKILPTYLVPIFILLGQTLLLTLPFVGLYRFYGLLPAIAFLLYFPLWYNALFDFHIDHLAVPLLFGFFLMEKKGKIGFAVVCGILLALVKEIFAIQAIFCGIYLFLISRHRREGSILILISSAYFFISLVYLKVYFNPSIDVVSSIQMEMHPTYSWLGSDFTQIALRLLTQPHWVAEKVFTDPERLKYLIYLFGALGFIPLIRPGILLITIPVLAHSLLSSEPLHYGFTYHYTAGLIIPNIIAFSEGLPQAKKIWERVRLKTVWFNPVLCSGLLICHILLSPSPIGRKFYSTNSWNHHYSNYLPSDRDRLIKEALKTHISSDPNIIVSVQNSINFHYLMERKIFRLFPDGAVDKSKYNTQRFTFRQLVEFMRTEKIPKVHIENKFADYVVLDFKRAWFNGTQTCEWVSGQCKGGTGFESSFMELIKKTKKNFEVLFEQDEFIILQRVNNDNE
jgi:uncharacterized membrane protein